MEIDQELALIKKNKAPMGLVAPGSAAAAAAPAEPQPIEAAAPAPITPAAVDLPKAPSQLDAELGLPAFDAETPAPPVLGASTWDVMGAAWEAETIKTDAWSYAEGKRQELSQGMFEQLSPEGQRKVRARAEEAPTGDVSHDWQTFQSMVMEQATAEAEADPQAAARFAPFPMTEEDFQKRINTERRQDYDKAQGVLDQPGGGFAEFLGASARALTDEINLPLLPLGVTGSTWRVIAGEGALNATAEALGLPREFAVARELDLPPPDAASRIAMGAALGSGIAGALIGIGKGASKALGLSRTYSETRKINAGNLDAEHGIDAAEAKMRGEQSVQEVLGTPAGTAKFSGVADAGKGYTVLIGPDGQAVRREGTRAWRNNNPGNIEFGPFAKAHGAIGTDGRFAVFPSYEAGRAAKGALLFESKGYRDLTIGQAIARYAPSFENDTGAYTRAVTKSIGATSGTRMADLTPQQRGLMLSAMERVEGFRPGKENGVSVAGRTASDDAPSYTPTSRGYTESGQIAVGDNLRIDVKYEVVDASSLLRASGDLQPRDRSRANSDAWISDTAARLDPAQLMPAPTADRGTPIVGPDQTIESGNGRVGAIERAYERHPDRAAAYRSQIEAAGYAIPEGVQRPVLIARRTSEITPEQRRQLVIDAQDSGVAQMTPTEVAQTASRAMDAQALARLDPSLPLDHADNLNFLGRALSLLPKSSRNAMAASDGSLNQSARRMLREAIFARAWRDPDMVELFTEAEQGQLKGLMDALGDAAPHWAVLQAEIEAGLVRPEMDISGFVLDAMRLIANARTLATQSKIKINFAIAELLEEIDLVAGPVSPLTVALVKKFWRNGHATKAEEVAQFLSRYADDARKAGKTGDIFDQPSPRDVLAAIEPKLFSDLPEDIGQARGFARKTPAQDAPAQGYDTGAESPEALAADQAARDAFEAPAQPADAQQGLAQLVADGASAAEIMAHPEVTAALDKMAAVDLTTNLPQYGSESFWASREYLAKGEKLLGKDRAVDYLYDASRTLAWTDEGLQPPASIKSDRQATILLGAPAAGKSSVANPLARERQAAIIDADEAKKLIPEYQGGIGANAVHEESGVLGNEVLRRAILNGDNIVVPKVGAAPGSIATLIEALKGSEYRVEVILVDVPPAEAWRRMIGRFEATGRIIPPEVMEKGIVGAPKTYDVLKADGKANAYAKIDNSPGFGEPRRILDDSQGIVPADLGRAGGDRSAPGGGSALDAGGRSGQGQDQGVTAPAAAADTPKPIDPQAAAIEADLSALRDQYADQLDSLEIDLGGGNTVTAREIFADLDADAQMAAAVRACAISPGGA